MIPLKEYFFGLLAAVLVGFALGFGISTDPPPSLKPDFKVIEHTHDINGYIMTTYFCNGDTIQAPRYTMRIKCKQP